MALVPTTVNDGLLGGGDFRVGKSLQTIKGAINANPVFNPVRRRSGKTSKTIGYVQDETVSDTYQGQEQIQDTKSLAVAIEASFVKQSVDLLIESIYAAETLYTVTASTFAALVDGFTFTAPAYAAISVGDGFWMTGFTNPDLNVFYIVGSKDAANKVTTTVAPVAAEAAGASVTLKSNKYINSNNAYYSTFQTRTTDLSAAGGISHHTIYDAIPNNFSAEIGENGIIGATVDYVAEREYSANGVAIATPFTGQSYAAAQFDRPLSAVQNVKNFYVNGLIATCKMKSLSFAIALNQQGDPAAGCTDFFTRGALAITGSTVVRSMKSNPFIWRNYFWEGTRVSISVLLDHGGGDQTYIVFPQVVVTEGPQDDGNNAISNTQASFTAEGHAASNSTMRVYRNW